MLATNALPEDEWGCVSFIFGGWREWDCAASTKAASPAVASPPRLGRAYREEL